MSDVITPTTGPTPSYGTSRSTRGEGWLITWLPWAAFCRVFGHRSNRRAAWVALRVSLDSTRRTELRVQYPDGWAEWVDVRAVSFSAGDDLGNLHQSPGRPYVVERAAPGRIHT